MECGGGLWWWAVVVGCGCELWWTAVGEYTPDQETVALWVIEEQIKKTQDELQWIVAQRLLSALTIPGFS